MKIKNDNEFEYYLNKARYFMGKHPDNITKEEINEIEEIRYSCKEYELKQFKKINSFCSATHFK
jgi:YesN/AraC family two-component response regulator